MLKTRFIASVSERDIDLLLLEEFSVSIDFRKWFQNRVAHAYEYQAEKGAWHSLVESELGESDIVFVYISRSNQRVAILIENKIDAPPQPEQAQRYSKRGEKGIKDGYWDLFKTCVIAPQRYLNSSKHDQDYDVEVSYEELSEYFAASDFDSARSLYKASIVREGIEQNRRGYQPEYSSAMTAFVADYYAIATQDFPELHMQEPKPRPSGSTWIIFKPAVLPHNAYLCHQLSAGAVKIFFSAPHSLESVTHMYGPYVSPDVTIEPAGKSVALIMQVPKICPQDRSVAQELEAVMFGLKIAVKLLRVAQRAAASNRLLQSEAHEGSLFES